MDVLSHAVMGAALAAGVATDFVSHHDFSPAMRRDFFAMLLGRDIPAPKKP